MELTYEQAYSKLEEILKGKNTILNKYWLYTYNRLYNIS